MAKSFFYKTVLHEFAKVGCPLEKKWIYVGKSTDSHATNENTKEKFGVLFSIEIAEQALANEFF